MFHFTSEEFSSKLFCSDEGIPLVMPCIFSHSLFNEKKKYTLSYTDEGFRRIKAATLKPIYISNNTISEIINELKNFLIWLEGYSVDKQHVSLEVHHNLHEEILNYYVNQVLIREQMKSQGMAKKSLNSLRAYYNFLAYHGFTNLKKIDIDTDSLALSVANTKPRNVIKYYSEGLRGQLYANAKTLRNECILRAGGSCGVRAMENVGFVLNDFNVGNKKYKGLNTLFIEMDNNPEQQEFEFYLQGKYSKSKRAKGGKSRLLHIPKETLQKFKEYKEEERPECSIDNLFVTDPASSYLKEISVACVTRAFDDVRATILEKQLKGLLPEYLDMLQKEHSYHILRHSFGTDTFYDAAQKSGMKIDDVTSMSQPYLLTARLLGHETEGGYAPKITRTYIRSCHEKIKLMS